MSRALARLFAVLVLATGAALTGVAPALAHIGGDRAGSDFDGRVRSVTPEVAGVTVRVLQFGDQLEVVNATGSDVVVPGYSREPYLRIGPDGVWRNARSPATYLNLDRFGRAAPPAAADPTADPDWVRVSTEPRYAWHDHRTHWMSEGQLPPMVAADPTRAHTVSEWAVPMSHAGRSVTVVGVLTWSPPPPAWLVWPFYAALVAAAVAAGWLARTARPLGWLLLLGAAASLSHALTTPGAGDAVRAIASALLPALLASMVAVLGVLAAQRGRGALTGLLAVVLGWLLLVQGLPDVDALWSAHVLTAGPAVLGRAAVAVLVGLGVGGVLGGIGALRRFRAADVPAGG